MSTFSSDFPTLANDPALEITAPPEAFTNYLNSEDAVPTEAPQIIADASTETTELVVEDDVNRLIDPDNPQRPIVEPNDRIVIGVSTRGNALADVLDKLLVESIKQVVKQIPASQLGGRKQNEVIQQAVQMFKQTDQYANMLGRLEIGQAGVDDIKEYMSEQVATMIGKGNVEIAFDPLNAIGFEIWVPPLSDEALANFTDDEGNILTDMVSYLTDTIGNGFLNIKVFPEEFAKLPGVADEAKVRLMTSLMTYAVTALGAAEAGTELDSIASEFIQSGGTIFSGDTTRGTNFQVGFPIRGFKGEGDNKIGLNEVWFTALNYNIPIVPDDGSGFYLGYSDLRRLVLKPDAEGDWDIAQFVSADRAIEAGFNFNTPDNVDPKKPAKRRIRADGVGVHVGSIGTFAIYMDKEAVANGQIRQLENGQLGYLVTKNEDTFQDPTDLPEELYFKPFNDQEQSMFENVFLTGDDGITLDDVQVLRESADFTVLTDADVARMSELGPTTTWFAKVVADPQVQDSWTGGVTMIPALLTGNPVAIGFAGVNSYVEITQNQFNRSYTEVINEYRGDDGKIDTDRFAIEQLVGFSADWEEIKELHSELQQIEGYEDVSMNGFLTIGAASLLGNPQELAPFSPNVQALSLKAAVLHGQIEQRMENLQGFSTRLIREGYADATDLHESFTRYTRPDADGYTTPPEGSELLFGSVADRLFGERKPLILEQTEDGTVTADVGNPIANLMALAIDTSRPEALEILEATNSLQDLSNFEFSDLDRLEDFETVAAFVETLSAKPDMDQAALYNQLKTGKWRDRADDIIDRGSADLRQTAAIFDSVQDSFLAIHEQFPHNGADDFALRTPTRATLDTFLQSYDGDPVQERPQLQVSDLEAQFNIDGFAAGVAQSLATNNDYDPDIGTGIPALDDKLSAFNQRLGGTLSDDPEVAQTQARLLSAQTIMTELDEAGVSALRNGNLPGMFEAAGLPPEHLGLAVEAATAIMQQPEVELGLDPNGDYNSAQIATMDDAFIQTMELYLYGDSDEPNSDNTGFVKGGLAGAEAALKSVLPADS